MPWISTAKIYILEVIMDNNYQQTPYDPQQGESTAKPIFITPMGNGLGVAALVVGVLALIGSWIPLLNIVSFVFAIISIGLGVGGIIVGVVKKRSKGMAIAGIILGVITIIIFATVNIGVANVLDATTNPSSDTKSQVVKEGDGAPLPKTFNIGDTIETDKCVITINNIEFSYDVLPDNTSSYYGHYAADSGKVYIHIDTDVKNIQKSDLGVDEIMSITADYNNGYSYSGWEIAEDSDSGFDMAFMTSIKPLDTLGIRYLIECPDEVATSSNPLVVTLKIDGEKYDFQMR
jgi:hypothetical protein